MFIQRARKFSLVSLSTVVCGVAAFSACLMWTCQASADPTFGVMNAEGGIYWRSAPDWNTPEAVSGNGFYPGTVIAVHCYQSGAGNVPGSTDSMWEQATDVGGPGFGSGWINEHFINDNQPINQASPGVPPCSGGSSPPPATPAPSAPAPAPAPSAPAPSTPAPGSTAAAATNFPVMNAGGGVYWRASPNWSSAIAKVGNGFYPGTIVHVICSQSGGTVPGSANSMWVQASWVSGPGKGNGWVNEHFVNDNAPSNQAAPGVPSCGSASTPLSVGCYGDYCSGKDPKQTGCSADAQTLGFKNLSGARLELRWSSTCKTEWARWIQYPPGNNPFADDWPTALAAVQDTGYRQTASYDINGSPTNKAASETSNGIVTSWTPMIYSPVHLVKAVVTLQCGDNSLLGTAINCLLDGKEETSSH